MSHGWDGPTWDSVLAVPLATCMILSKPLHPYLKNNTYLSFMVVVGITNNVFIVLDIVVTNITRNIQFWNSLEIDYPVFSFIDSFHLHVTWWWDSGKQWRVPLLGLAVGKAGTRMLCCPVRFPLSSATSHLFYFKQTKLIPKIANQIQTKKGKKLFLLCREP